MRVFRQVNASEIETKAWEERFSQANSPAQIKGALQVGVNLLNGRINAINNRWNRSMETNTGYPNILSNEAKGVLETLNPSAASASPAAQKITATGPNGQKLELVNGKWQPIQ